MKDAGLREALVRIASRVEGGGPAGMGIDMTTEDGRAAWSNVRRAYWWIYEQAIDRLVDVRRKPGKGRTDAAGTADG